MNLKTNLVLLLGVIIGVSLCQLLKSCSSSDETVAHYPTEKIAETKKEFLKKETKLLQKEDSLKQHDAGLKKELTKTKQSLQQLKETNTFLKIQLLDLLDKKIQADASDSSSYTDTLASRVNELIDNNNQQDSSYEIINGNLEEQVNNKDSLISTQQDKYAELKMAFEKSLNEKDFLTEENSQLRKQFKKQKVKRKFLSAVMLIASGTAAGILLHH